ncbi:GIY-YIG nuclease family protein [Haloarcula salinisoli]|uniref:GIY-YIG nuclease family protein n=1 Tax=Haloarcula salinisoli TaxID=2487746 RepID=A0A8J7YDA0_9EURY|nr:GIY-YIG nuclease family protein [Halomicroarcula salinisoli]MBX0286634.1 GIY-YIG nuclease family protein [Halomicroarcula salinisoli]MBX0303945.1 GIY-YIG nuclease family protein [Halomicroarcula salinisoli]
MAAGGTYTLVLERESDGPIEVGALGDIDFPAGWYAYTGSALGSGGFSRVERHRAVASGGNDARHWHIDYLLGEDATSVETVVTTAVDIECAVARRLADTVGGAVPDFGCSDCGCRSHLVGCDGREELVAAVERAHDVVASERD